MKALTQHLHEELLSKLEDLDKTFDPRNLPDPRLDLISNAIEEIKQKLIIHQFLSEETEVHYFKSVLPETLSLHIYYSDRIEWDRIRLQGSSESRDKFTDRIYIQVENFRNSHKDFYEYCRDGKTHLDQFYFLRNSPVNLQGDYPIIAMIDLKAPPIYCGMKAKLLAYTRLEFEMHISDSGNGSKCSHLLSNEPGLTWTIPKIKLIEMIYSLKEARAFNHGNADLIAIQTYFEKVFGVSLGNISRSFQELLTRKKAQTPFLDQLKELLTKRISEVLD